METTEKIVESYVRYVRRWATIPNIRCEGQYEIDLIAINPIDLSRYHIETSVSGSASFSRLTNNQFDPQLLKQRVHQAKMRRTLGYFIQHKFGTPAIKKRLGKFGFTDHNHKKVVVTWGWTPEAKQEADAAGVELWDFQKILREIADDTRNKRSYFNDDTLRTINLFVRALADANRGLDVDVEEKKHRVAAPPKALRSGPYWVYQNWIHKRARLHRSTCSHCNNGRGTQGSINSSTGEWCAFPNEATALKFLNSTGYKDAGRCSVCM
jgi:hypothetical protein